MQPATVQRGIRRRLAAREAVQRRPAHRAGRAGQGCYRRVIPARHALDTRLRKVGPQANAPRDCSNRTHPNDPPRNAAKRWVCHCGSAPLCCRAERAQENIGPRIGLKSEASAWDTAGASAVIRIASNPIRLPNLRTRRRRMRLTLTCRALKRSIMPCVQEGIHALAMQRLRPIVAPDKRRSCRVVTYNARSKSLASLK